MQFAKLKFIILIATTLLPLSISAQAHWESIIVAEDNWQYFEGNSEPDAQWNTLQFDAAAWDIGPGGIGYNDDDDETVIAAVSSVYLRRTFEVTSTTDIEQLVLDIDYDDGFVAYINGIEVARSSNVTTTNPKYNSGTSTYKEAQMYNGGSPEQYTIDMSSLLVGTNILAIHVLNYTATSSDLSAKPYLHAKISNAASIYQDTPSWFDAPVTFTGSLLPIVKIDTENQEILDDPKITAHLGIINNGEGNINLLTDTFTDYDGSIGIETRGQSSQYFFPKKSYGFETRDAQGENLNVNLLGMPKENDWILYAPYSDKSMMRNVVTFEMAKALDTYSSRTAFCEVFVNDEYQGIYVLMEKIKRDDSRVDIDSLVTISSDENSITGGYIFKVDKIDDDYTNLYTGWKTYPNPSYPNAMDITYQYVYPKVDDITNEERTYLKDHVTLAEEVLISSNFENRETGYNHYLNLGSFVDFLLINEVTKEVDKYRYSTYFHKKKDSKGGEIFAGPIWDFNLGYGNVDYWNDGNLTSGWIYSDVKNVDYGIMFWWKRLMEDEHFNSIATARYAQLRSNEWSDENVTYIIDSISSLVYDAQERNYKRWPILGTYVWPNKIWENMTYNDEVESFKTWTLARLSWIDSNMTGSAITPSVVASISASQSYSEGKEIEVVLQDQFFNHSKLKNKHFEIKNDDGLLDVDSVIYQSASKATLWVKGQTAKLISIEVSDNVLTGFDDLRSNTLDIAASIESTIGNTQAKLYAFQRILTLEVSQASLLGETVKVFNIQGQEVGCYSTSNVQKNEFKLTNSPGVYIISYEYNHQMYSSKIVISD